MRAWWTRAGTLMEFRRCERWVPQDLHGGRRDAASSRDAARRAHRSGAGIPPDGALHGRDVLADGGHVRQPHSGARLGTGRRPRTSRWWSIWTPRSARCKQKQGAAYGYTSVLGYHPLLATRADTGEVLGARSTCDAPGPPGRPRCAPTQDSGHANSSTASTPTTSSGRSPSPSDPPFAQRSKQSATPHGPTSPTPKAATPKSPKPNTPPAAAKPSAPSASSCAAPASPRAPNNDCGPTGDTTHSTPTPRHRRRGRVPPRPRCRHPRPQRRRRPRARPLRPLRRELAWLACAVLAHNSTRGRVTAPAHPTRRPRRRAGQPLRHTHPAIPRPLALGNTIHSHTLAALRARPPQAKRHSPELTPPHKPSVDNPKPHPHP